MSQTTDTRPPGSDAAIANGWRCPVADNAHGAGSLGSGYHWMVADCPLHGGVLDPARPEQTP